MSGSRISNISCLLSGESCQRKPENAPGCRHDGKLPPHLFYVIAPKDFLPGRRET